VVACASGAAAALGAASASVTTRHGDEDVDLQEETGARANQSSKLVELDQQELQCSAVEGGDGERKKS